MICPRCSVGEISETTQECLVCGFSPTGGVMVDATDWNRLDDPVITALERQFQVEGVLRRGAASRIYLARDQVSGRLCSLKVLPLAPFTSTSVIERFRQDAQHAANLDHPHLVAVDRFGVTDTALWYAMEYVQGRSLGDLLPTADRMDLKTCLRLVEQVASALEYGHRRGMVHGNLKPSNVLVDPEGWARVADFGLGAAFGSLPRRQPEMSFEENYGHVAPEQFGAHGEVGPASDQYALAVLVFSCLARRLPFGGDSLEEITLQHLEGPVPLLAETRPDLPEYVSPALARAMSRDPGERFVSVLDLATAIAGVPVPEITTASPEPARPEAAPVAIASDAAVEEPTEAGEPEPEAEAAPPVTEPDEETEEQPEPEPATEPAPPAEHEPAATAATDSGPTAEPEAEVGAEPAPSHPPLLFVERGQGTAEDDDDLDEDEERLAPAAGAGPGEPAPETGKQERKSREPVLLWRASREHPVPAAAAMAQGGAPVADGEAPNAAPPLLFRDKSGTQRRKAWEVVAVRALARFDKMAARWRALPRNLRIGSSAGAGALVLLAVVWWEVARGHEERRPELVEQASPVAIEDSLPPPSPAARPASPRTQTTPHNVTPAVPSQPTASASAGGSAATPPPRTAAASTTEPVHLYLNSTPWGYVYLDGKRVGNTPMDTLVAPGYHVISVQRDGFVTFEREVAIESGEVLRLTDILLQEKPQ